MNKKAILKKRYFADFTDLIITFVCENEESEKIVEEFLYKNSTIKVLDGCKVKLMDSDYFTKKEFKKMKKRYAYSLKQENNISKENLK